MYESVGHLIKLMQVHESDEAEGKEIEEKGVEKNRWLAPVPYEL